MLVDLDNLMRARGVDTVIVPMHESTHAAFRWITRGAKVTRGYAVKFAGQEPMLVTYPMERGEADQQRYELTTNGHKSSCFALVKKKMQLRNGRRAGGKDGSFCNDDARDRACLQRVDDDARSGDRRSNPRKPSDTGRTDGTGAGNRVLF